MSAEFLSLRNSKFESEVMIRIKDTPPKSGGLRFRSGSKKPLLKVVV